MGKLLFLSLAVAVSTAVNLMFPPDITSARFDLLSVDAATGESDILDYNLTFSDCLFEIARRAPSHLTCETVRN
ncbi:hypothetical protein HDIA_0722 [Hartmannibacter diazotrophicus]|uniref:Uncharacterized protein n=1 Tax=Hartmannibacter diazotrophicus TaxID=1482074 RepID=A0A2C9D218_9HYPH|nr:hypothetical protein [Hartmannibacter diazotrophicus]SON54263.1 hypothetical protein HDIA_0722 [Hartmannibacter diazotrophicus]